MEVKVNTSQIDQLVLPVVFLYDSGHQAMKQIE
jgi:hypothetical protein